MEHNPLTDRQTGYPSIDKPWLKLYSKGIGESPYNGSVYTHILDNNKEYLDNIAIQYFGKKVSYAQMFKNIDEIAQVLYSYGIRKGDNVAVLMLSCPELVYLTLALNKIGAIANMINPLFDEKQIRDRINETNASLLVVLDQLFERIEKVKAVLCINDIVVIPIERSMPLVTRMFAHFKLKKDIKYTENIHRWKGFVSENSSLENAVEISDNEDLPAVMVYSSGTTGTSKGIVLVNKGINSTISHYENSGFEYKRTDTFLQIVPTWFSTGIIFCLFMPLCLGIRVIIEPVFNEQNFVNDIFKYKPNMIMGATSLWLYSMKVFEEKKQDLSFITYPITGGEKLLLDTENKLNEMLNKYGCESHLVTGYGMCELGSTATSTSMKYSKPGTAGYPILGVTVSAFDVNTNKECQYMQRGEIRVLTPSRMKEYYKRIDATKDFFWKDDDGNEWGCTGDIGYVDEEGFVFIEGRASDYFINEAGESIYCFDIEKKILSIDSVYQCEVVGVTTNQNYDVPVVFVVLKSEYSADYHKVKKMIETYCIENILENSKPAMIYVLDKFPIKPSGKRDMEKLKKIALEILAEE